MPLIASPLPRAGWTRTRSRRGYVAHAEQSDWQHLALHTPGGIRVLPYGVVSEERRLRFEACRAGTPLVLEEALWGLLSIPHMVVLADTPPGPSPALNALNAIADICIAVLLADAASASLLPQIEQGLFHGSQGTGNSLPVICTSSTRSTAAVA